MNYYLISDNHSGNILGIYQGETKVEAWRECVKGNRDPDAYLDDDIDIRLLEDYEPEDDTDPCQAGTYREDGYYRAVCYGGVYHDGANARTREEAREVLSSMLGR